MILPGPYERVLSDVFADVMITDPPYTEKTHNGQSAQRKALPYAPWSMEYYHSLLWWAEKHVRGWWVIITDHIAWRWIDDWMAPCKERGIEPRYAFAPIPIVVPGCTCRFQADGPASWAVFAHVSRPATRAWSQWRALPGAYITDAPEEPILLGEKSLSLMLSLVRDYSREGMTVVDPCCGTGKTIRAARILGRDGIGAEIDPQMAKIAQMRLEEAFTPEFV